MIDQPEVVTPAIKVRRLAIADAAAFVALRREALDAEPLSFGASQDDDIGLVLESVRGILGNRALMTPRCEAVPNVSVRPQNR